MKLRLIKAAAVLAAVLGLVLLSGCAQQVAGTGRAAAAAATLSTTPTTPTATTEQTQESADITVGTWSGTDSDGDFYEFTFVAGGHVSFTSPNGSYDDVEDTWSLDGADLTISISGGYAIYTGVVEGQEMHGRASNQNGRSWTWTFTQQS